MRYLFESILVGIYSVIIYLFIQYFISSFTLSLLIVGFLKHYLGYYIGIHNLYCNYGDSSLKLHNNNTNYISNNNFIYYYSFFDAFLYLIFGYIFSILLFWYHNIKIKHIIIFFFIGIFIHILYEKLFIHYLFFMTNCNKI
jgi:hypothetical protein